MSEKRAQRRLAAILAADVVGYSRLMELDEAGTLAALKARRNEVLVPVVAQHNGRVVKVRGDGVLVEFASAVDAVQCAIEVQKRFDSANHGVPETNRIILRIGINLGDVIVEGQDIYGDGVNVAARLEALAEPRGIYVSGSVYEQVKRKLASDFDDLGPQVVKNIIEPVQVYRVRQQSTLNGVPAGAEQQPLAIPAKPSIAVLPFTNMSGDPEQEYFSDGITEDIITEISRFRNFIVIARNSSFAYKGAPVSVAKIARELGVTYILEGSVRKSGSRVRITAQLIDSQTGGHIWADRYDREIADVFSVQDEITQKIVGMLAVGLEEDTLERAKRKHPENLTAYDHWLRGKRKLSMVGSGSLDARCHFERAAAADPNFSRAYSGLSITYQMEALDFSTAAEGTIAYDKAFEYAQMALMLDDADYQAHIALAWPCLYRGDYMRMKKHVDRAIMLNPNDADSLASASYMLAMYGEGERAVECAQTAVRLNPRHPDWYIAFQATALFTARRYPEAFAARIKVPDYFIDSPFFGAAILVQMDRLDEARQWAERAVAGLRARPGGAQLPAKGCIQLLLDNNPFRLEEDRDHFAESMRKAGVPG